MNTSAWLNRPPYPTRALALLGNAADINAWSNIPYYLFQAAEPKGVLTHALDLVDPSYFRHRAVWNALSLLRGERPGFYQYSRVNIRRMWERIPAPLREGEILSHFQVFPPLDLALESGARHSFYCDATLRQLSPGGPNETFGGRRTYADALAREKDLYQAARFFISMARETSRVAMAEYGVPAEKVHTVRPGANLDEATVRRYIQQRGTSWREIHPEFEASKPATLGFIGRGWQRKGLMRIVGAAQILKARGKHVRVSIIGDCPEHLIGLPLIEYHGRISKATDLCRFLEIMDTFAMGCLPSYSEPLGIGTLECLRMGIPVMGTRVGGIPDCVPPDGGFLVDPDATDEAIADAFEQNLFDPKRYQTLVQGAHAQMELVTWERTATQLAQIFK